MCTVLASRPWSSALLLALTAAAPLAAQQDGSIFPANRVHAHGPQDAVLVALHEPADHDLDLMWAETSGADLVTKPNIGFGTFGLPTAEWIFQPPMDNLQMVAADRDGDGDVDAALRGTGNVLRLVTNLGLGTFTTQDLTFHSAMSLRAMAAGDIVVGGGAEVAVIAATAGAVTVTVV